MHKICDKLLWQHESMTTLMTRIVGAQPNAALKSHYPPNNYHASHF